MNKFIIALSLCVVSSASWAAGTKVCGAGTATAWTATSNFTKSSFTPKCSTNTYVHFEETTNSAAVAGLSTKGNEVFAGHTAGGAVIKAATGCTVGGCVEGDLAAPIAAAIAASSS